MTMPGLADLYSALAPRVEAPVPLPDLDAIHAAGWQAGFAAGEAATASALAPLCADLAAAAAALDAATEIDRDVLRPLFAALVGRIAAAVLMAELRAGTPVLLPLVDAALAQVHVGEVATLWAHPETLATLQPHLPHLATGADPTMAPGAFRVTGPTFVIETGIATRLADIVAALA